MFKSQLQEFVQKSGWPAPHYETVKEGVPHLPRFKSKVEVNGVLYESEAGYATLKAAEHAAAKKALDALQGSSPSPRLMGLCKNLLQEYAQKSGMSLPIYRVESSGLDHDPSFVAKVEVNGIVYTGGQAKSKKEAEVKAARTAVLSIKDIHQTALATPEPAEALPPVEPTMRKRKRLNSRISSRERERETKPRVIV